MVEPEWQDPCRCGHGEVFDGKIGGEKRINLNAAIVRLEAEVGLQIHEIDAFSVRIGGYFEVNREGEIEGVRREREVF